MLGPLLGGQIKTWTNEGARLWQVPPGSALERVVAGGTLARLEGRGDRGREVGRLRLKSGSLQLPPRTYDAVFSTEGEIVQLAPMAGTPHLTGNQAKELYELLARGLTTALREGGGLELGLGGWEPTLTPFARIIVDPVHAGELLVQTSPRPGEGTHWAGSLDAGEDVASVRVPMDEAGRRSAIQLMMAATLGWKVLPWDLALTFLSDGSSPSHSAGGASRGAPQARNDVSAIPMGHRCESVDDFVTLLRTWVDTTDEPTIGSAPSGSPTQHVLVSVGGIECFLSGRSTRAGVLGFLRLIDRTPLLTVMNPYDRETFGERDMGGYRFPGHQQVVVGRDGPTIPGFELGTVQGSMGRPLPPAWHSSAGGLTHLVNSLGIFGYGDLRGRMHVDLRAPDEPWVALSATLKGLDIGRMTTDGFVLDMPRAVAQLRRDWISAERASVSGVPGLTGVRLDPVAAASLDERRALSAAAAATIGFIAGEDIDAALRDVHRLDHLGNPVGEPLAERDWAIVNDNGNVLGTNIVLVMHDDLSEIWEADEDELWEIAENGVPLTKALMESALSDGRLVGIDLDSGGVIAEDSFLIRVPQDAAVWSRLNSDEEYASDYAWEHGNRIFTRWLAALPRTTESS